MAVSTSGRLLHSRSAHEAVASLPVKHTMSLCTCGAGGLLYAVSWCGARGASVHVVLVAVIAPMR